MNRKVGLDGVRGLELAQGGVQITLLSAREAFLEMSTRLSCDVCCCSLRKS
jgi:hypothetical protein